MIHVERLSKSYGRVHALTDVTFDVGHGEAVAISGPTGSAPSTLLRIMATRLRNADRRQRDIIARQTGKRQEGPGSHTSLGSHRGSRRVRCTPGIRRRQERSAGVLVARVTWQLISR